MPDVFAFARRWNRDGTVDSICNLCLKKVATGKSEMHLVLAEIAHRCVGPEIHANQTAGLLRRLRH